MGMNEEVEMWLSTLLSPNTKAAYRRDMAVFVAWAQREGRPTDILIRRNGRPAGRDSHREIALFREYCERTDMGESTRSRRISTVAAFVRFTATPLLERSSSAEHAEVPEHGTASLEPDVATAVWRAAVASGPRPAALVGLILHEGLKLGDAIALDVASVHLGRQTAIAVVPRRKSIVEVQLGRPTTRQLTRLIGQRRRGPLFESESAGSVGTRLSRFGADYLVKAVGQRAALARPLTTNELRSTHVAMARRRGESPDAIQIRLGHRSVQTTNRYLPPTQPDE